MQGAPDLFEGVEQPRQVGAGLQVGPDGLEDLVEPREEIPAPGDLLLDALPRGGVLQNGVFEFLVGDDQAIFQGIQGLGDHLFGHLAFRIGPSRDQHGLQPGGGRRSSGRFFQKGGLQLRTGSDDFREQVGSPRFQGLDCPFESRRQGGQAGV